MGCIRTVTENLNPGVRGPMEIKEGRHRHKNPKVRFPVDPTSALLSIPSTEE